MKKKIIKTKKTKKTKKDKKDKKDKKTKKIKKYYKQKGGEEKMSVIDPDIIKRKKEREKKRLMLQTLIKLARVKNQKSQNFGKPF